MVADVSIRLSVQDGEVVRTALKNIGRDGEAAWGRIEASAVRASTATSRAGKAINDNAPNYRRFGAAAQQAGYQVGDFAVQVASGQSALVALTQQGAQLLGFFGPWGAVVGAGAAIAGALAVSLWDTGDAADDAEEALKTYEEAIKSAESFVKRLNDETKESSTLLRDERDEILKNAQARVDAAKTELATYRQQIRLAEETAKSLGLDRDGLTGEKVEFVDPAQRQALVDALAGAEAEFRKLETQINAAIQKNEEFKASQDDTKASEKAAKEAEKHAESIRKVVDALNAERDATLLSDREKAISNALRRVSGDLSAQEAAQIREAAGAAYDYQQRVTDLNDALDREQKLMLEGEKVQQQTRTAQEQYNEELERLSELRKAGAIDEETYGRAAAQSADTLEKAQERLRRQQEKLNEVGRGFGQAFSSSFEQMAISGAKFGDVLKSLEQDIARVILRASVTGPLESAIGGIDFGSIFGSFFGGGAAASGPGVSYPAGSTFADGGIMTPGGAMSLPVRTYASGGIATSPQVAIYGEGRMNEAYVPLPDGRTIPVTMKGGGEAFTYAPTIMVDARGSNMTNGEIKAIVKTSVDQSVAEVRNIQKRKGNARI